MTHIEIEKGVFVRICITDIEINLDDETNYELSDDDGFSFVIRKAGGKSMGFGKHSPDTIELQNSNLIINIAPEETRDLASVLTTDTSGAQVLS